MALGAAGLELGVAGQVLEAYYKGKWRRIASDTPICVLKGGIVAVKLESVEDICNWDIDKDFLT
jgi:hypothetical protein